ncbi:glycosyltransferase [Bhargavaea beijingensis]|uniref:Glycosyltransferase n=1 Tax=Bhargavaea beijingensis TaxID=426756 RepID=A0ABX9ZDU3_9BACL|nr:glycosyltransferase [Bhargavaea beijingensis]RSK33695.1 glycosyltransferase [Bhargavaea beijingensis]
MNIVYISMLTGKKSAGLTYSIPAQIKSQKKMDNVFWYNINATVKNKLINGQLCNNTDDFPTLKIGSLPAPFNHPDLVVFQGVYIYKYIKIYRECKIRRIPYIIIPRSSLTKIGQQQKMLKKKVANQFIFKKFINDAAAIQYLTQREYRDSGDFWNSNHIIIPNGVEKKARTRRNNKNRNIRGVFIGRADSSQKGIDLLLDACKLLKNEFSLNNCKIDIYAPNSREDKDNINKMILERDLQEYINKYDGIYGLDKEEVLLNSDFFILTSRFEGHPTGLIEALSYGIPCLVTEGTNMAQEINDYKAGWSSETSVEGIVHAFRELFGSSNKLEDFSRNALELSKIYSWDYISEISHTEYIKLINKQTEVLNT